MLQPLNVSTLRSFVRLGLGVSLLSVMSLAIAPPTRAGDRQTPRPTADHIAQSSNIPAPSSRTLERDTLSLGSEGEDVREFQAMLALLGYYSGEITGRFDQATAQAARSFQASASLVTDAVIGPVTWGRLLPAALDSMIVQAPATASTNANNANTVPAPDRVRTSNRSETGLPTLQLGSNDSLVSYLQQRLAAMGYYSGAIDGDFGPMTQAAVIEAQIDFGLVPDGVVDSSVWPYLIN